MHLIVKSIRKMEHSGNCDGPNTVETKTETRQCTSTTIISTSSSNFHQGQERTHTKTKCSEQWIFESEKHKRKFGKR
jgi:hypothetical protein